ncbi:MAG TPA: hypothetical protein VLL52_05285 [Anaerolineae bacterium]|nr:hypothetical protein [Anaerolineae bacterium]
MSEEQDEKLENIFVSLVKRSWQYHEESLRNRRLDDLLVGAVIASNVRRGYSLIDLNSDGRNHFLRFEDLATQKRLVFQLRNLSEDLVTAKTLGQRAEVTIGYGEQVANFGKVWEAFKAEVKGVLADQGEPGAVRFDADMVAGYVYAQILLILDLEPYLGKGYQVNYKLLEHHLGAVTHSLAKYLHGRIGK